MIIIHKSSDSFVDLKIPIWNGKNMASSLLLRILLVLCSILILVCSTDGQQCLDLLPPFVPTSPLQFCHKTSGYGCCTSDDDSGLRDKFFLIRSRVPQDQRPLSHYCLTDMKGLLCARCSPNSADIFDRTIDQYTESSTARVFPGLCRDYCIDFYTMCADFVEHYLAVMGQSSNTSEVDTLKSLASGTEVSAFCEAVSLPADKSESCYPGVNTTTEPLQADCVCLQPHDSVFRNPVALTSADDGSGRLFVVERIGVVSIISTDGTLYTQDFFLDIRDKLFDTGDGFSQLGLLGLTFHPKFKDNNKLYVIYTTESMYVTVEEFRASDVDPNIVDQNRSRVILQLRIETTNHAGGPV